MRLMSTVVSRYLLILAILGFAIPLAAQIPATLTHQLESRNVGETREVFVSLPDNYAESGQRYPVVYLMDGEMNFNSGLIGGFRHAAQMGEMPEFIIVGIKNTNRSKDIFPTEITYPNGSKDGGRADQYLDFIREELVPHIEKTYRTEGFRILYGTSNTGFTAVYALFRNPALANAYIAASATLSVSPFQGERDKLIRDFKGGNRKLFLVMGEHDFPTVVSLNGSLKEKIASSAPAGLSCRLSVIPHGEHVPANSLLEGMRNLFDGWKITQGLTEGNFAETRAQVESRLAKFGIAGKLPEEALKDLGSTLLGEKKPSKAIDVFQYRVDTYPRSAQAHVDLGEAYIQKGDAEQARECFKQALILAPGHAKATTKLKALEK